MLDDFGVFFLTQPVKVIDELFAVEFGDPGNLLGFRGLGTGGLLGLHQTQKGHQAQTGQAGEEIATHECTSSYENRCPSFLRREEKDQHRLYAERASAARGSCRAAADGLTLLNLASAAKIAARWKKSAL